MTDARTLLDSAVREHFDTTEFHDLHPDCADDLAATPSGEALLAATAAADTLRSRVAALEGLVRSYIDQPWRKEGFPLATGCRSCNVWREGPADTNPRHAPHCLAIAIRAALTPTPDR